MWNEAVVAYFKALPHHLPAGTYAKDESINQDTQC
jgi:hypothetical protein